MNRIQAPKSVALASLNVGSPASLILKGQGVYLFETTALDVSGVSLRFLNADASQELRVDWSSSSVSARVGTTQLIDVGNTSGLVGKPGAFYWVSIDAHNRLLIAGVGEARMETRVYAYDFPTDFSNDVPTSFSLHELTTVYAGAGVQPLRLLRDPVTHSMPLVVKQGHQLTMDDIASASYMPKANLSLIAQKLHDCIAGPSFVLDDADFPHFSDAIEASIANPDGWCYKRLAEKATEFGPSNPAETYLRITLGQNNGESPGIPYVMEIWPPGHFSPVHNHAGSHAVIRVLHGAIQVRLFPYLCCDLSGVPPFSTTAFSEGDITWISPTLNQTHQLMNVGSSTCVTIQCYMYDGANRLHYDFFDYVDADGVRRQYTPDSDMDFVAFKSFMKGEWEARRRGTGCCAVA
jgi:hypothetical protein